ncbi:MAG: hypothetical protein AMXMBFR64_16810 [Myxococcales bacterium]
MSDRYHPRAKAVAELETAGVLLVQDGNHGEYRPRTEEFCVTGTAFIRASDMHAGRVLFCSASQINDQALSRIRKGVGRPGDVVFSHKGTVGKLALVPMNAPPFVCSPQTTFWRVLDEKIVDRRFLYYFMQSDAFREQWEARKGETDMADYVSLTAQRELIVDVPPIDEQRAIAEVLGALDDKIELNRQMNRTLEEMASALFKSWFVDFDPVVAKAEGRRPFGIDAETAALFPAAFEDSELGPIPHGWRATAVEACVAEIFDGPHATPPVACSGAVFLGIGNMTGTGLDLGDVRYIAESDWARWTRRVTPAEGDIVFTYEAALGRFALVPAGLRCCLGRRMALVRPRRHADAPFLFHQFVAPPFQEVVAARSWTGSTVDRTPLTEFPGYPFLWPGEALVTRFSEEAAPMWDLIHHNQAESHTLSTLRDTLLPKLLSGEVRLKQAEKAVEAAL